MNNPILVLQYPDNQRGRTVALASTRDIRVLLAFKHTVITAARIAVTECDDDILRFNEESEAERLETLLGELIPDGFRREVDDVAN